MAKALPNTFFVLRHDEYGVIVWQPLLKIFYDSEPCALIFERFVNFNLLYISISVQKIQKLAVPSKKISETRQTEKDDSHHVPDFTSSSFAPS